MKRLVYQLFGLIVGVQLLVSVAVPKHLNADVSYDEIKAYQEKYQEDQWSNQLIAYAQTLVGKHTGQCVLTLRNYFGVPKAEVHGAAKSTKVNSPVGKVGHIIVFARLSWAGHVGIIIQDAGDGWYYFDGNGDGRGTGAIRWVAKSDPKITGYRIIKYN